MSNETFEILKKYHTLLKTFYDIQCGVVLHDELVELNEAAKEFGLQVGCYTCQSAKANFMVKLSKIYMEEVKKREAQKQQMKEEPESQEESQPTEIKPKTKGKKK